jgi:hypothetical protein
MNRRKQRIKEEKRQMKWRLCRKEWTRKRIRGESRNGLDIKDAEWTRKRKRRIGHIFSPLPGPVGRGKEYEGREV